MEWKLYEFCLSYLDDYKFREIILNRGQRKFFDEKFYRLKKFFIVCLYAHRILLYTQEIKVAIKWITKLKINEI